MPEAQEIASQNHATTAREHGYIDAPAEIYKEDSKDEYAHAQAYEQKMGALQAAYHDDAEATVLSAANGLFRYHVCLC